MATEPPWSIVFYLEESGSSPVEKFLDGLDHKTRGRLDKAIRTLQARNINATQPLIRQIRGKIYELRAGGKNTTYRILYFTMPGRNIVLLHAFQKKTETTPPDAIKLAEQRMASWQIRVGTEWN